MIALLFGVYSRSESQVFAAKSVPGYTCEHTTTGLPAGKTRCCGIDLRDTKIYCTDCDDTQPPSNCSPRFTAGRNEGETAPPTNVAPPKVCPDGSSPDANGVCPPVTQGSTSSLPSNTTTPKGATGAIEQPPAYLASQPKTSQRAFSPTGGCVPGGTTCIPCDPGLATHGANCIPSSDWRSRSSGLETELGGGGSSTPPTVQQPPAQSDVVKQPPTNLAPPPPPSRSQATTCHDGSTPDTNGQCPTTGNQNLQQQHQQQQSGGNHNVNQQSQSSGSANLAPDNNNPTKKDHKPKGSDLGK
jgi:hypothetical protein